MRANALQGVAWHGLAGHSDGSLPREVFVDALPCGASYATQSPASHRLAEQCPAMAFTMTERRKLSAEEQDALLAQWSPLVRKLAKRAHARWGKAGEREDFFQEGAMGLVSAAESYDAGRGVTFMTYASVTVWNRMRSFGETAGVVRLPSNVFGKAYREKKNGAALVEKATRAAFCKGFGDLPGKDERDYDPAARGRERRDEEAVSRAVELLRFLSPLERYVLECRAGLNGRPEMNLKCLAAALGLSRVRVQQIEAKALAKLRRHAEGDPCLDEYRAGPRTA